jgi:hypothetical protein
MTAIRTTRALLLALTLGAAPTGQAQADAWWRHVTVLAHDSMRGRDTGTPEYRKAALYAADVFRRAGLEPAGTDGFLQPVPFTRRSLDETTSRLTVIRDGRERALALGEDAAFVLRAPLVPSIEAPVVFAGYGLHLPEYNHDDLAGLDLAGKIVACVAGMPEGIPGPVVSHARAQAWPAMRARGAVGLLVFAGSRTSDSAFPRAVRNRLAPQLTLSDSTLDTQRGNQLSLQFNSARAEALFDGAVERFAVVAARADSGFPVPRFDLPVTIRATARTTEQPITSDNVIGVLRGSDPALRDEFVVLSAHLDHVGVGRPAGGDSIYNGAMDNASGAALLLETARALAAQRTSLKRSVIFALVTAEEKGLLGSRHFAFHPTVPPGAIVANLNTDMFLPLMPFRMLLVNGLEESDLADDARRVGAAMGVDVITDPEPEENRFVRSDQYSFILRGIPALSLKVGFRRDSPEHEVVRQFRARRYHLPSDDVSQPVDRQAAEDFGKLYVELVKAVAGRPTRPSWNADSFFRRLGTP